MIVSIHQPAYLPWLGYFERINRSDIHVVLDHVQFEKNSFTNRNRVKGPNGMIWLTVPVQTKGKFGSLPIRDLMIPPSNQWARKHWRTIESIYRKAQFYKSHAGFLESAYKRNWESLIEITDYLNGYFLDALEIETKIVNSSALEGSLGSKSDLVLNICKSVGATKYLSGALGRNYLDIDCFHEAGIDVEFQDYIHPEYRQGPNRAFEPNLAVIDLLFNEGGNAPDYLS